VLADFSNVLLRALAAGFVASVIAGSVVLLIAGLTG
jgi:hypothetical protein